MILFIQKGLSSGLSRMMLPAAAGLASLLLGAGALAQTHPLADTGQVICYNDTGSTGSVSAGNPNPVQAGFEGQDCVRGAAAADAVDAMYKLGGSSRRGADYTKIANDGSELPANAVLGSGPGDWACTRDNVTGLIWEVKVNNSADLRHQNHTYTWYDTNAAVNGGNVGTIGTSGSCNSTLTHCNTTAFRDAVNAAGLCGANDWRLPTADELRSLVHYGISAGLTIDTTWFPNMAVPQHWTGQNVAPNPGLGWTVIFHSSSFSTVNFKSNAQQVRLVRDGQ